MTIAPNETEGVVKFHLDQRDGPAPHADFLDETKAWRAVLFRLGLTGQKTDRYGGLAYGNISLRISGNAFAISGTQTGGKERLASEDFCVIEEFDVDRNFVRSSGKTAPSSEVLTHAAVYQANPTCQSVIHVHSPELWNYALSRGLPATSALAAYGTSAMAQQAGLLTAGQAAGTLAMGGHRDGIIAFGGSTEAAATSLLRLLGRALAQSDGA